MTLCVEAVVLGAPHVIEQLCAAEIGVLLKKRFLCLQQAGIGWLGNHKYGVEPQCSEKSPTCLVTKVSRLCGAGAGAVVWQRAQSISTAWCS